MRRVNSWALIPTLFLAFWTGHATAQVVGKPPGTTVAQGAESAVVGKGAQYLRSQAAQMGAGEAALATLAMVKAEVPLNDPALITCIQSMLTTINGTAYVPQKVGGLEVYEAGVVILALVALDPVQYKDQIEVAAAFLAGRQLANGAWDYTNRSAGDTSMSQYALLGLWEADSMGIAVNPRVWDRAARWYLSVQSGGGSWNYHRDEPQWIETISMTAAGAGSLMICQRQLAPYRKVNDSIHPLLTPILPPGSRMLRYDVETSAASINTGIRRGLDWLSKNFKVTTEPEMGQSVFYGLYGIERTMALAEKSSLGGKDWYGIGLEFLTKSQAADGHWGANAQHGDVPNTCWGVLFLVRSMAKTMKKIEVRRLGAGTLLGGKGLPSDLSGLTIAQGRVLVRPMSGAVEGMLSVLEDPRAMNADSALAGLVDRYQKDGPKVLRPFKDRFRKLLTDPDPGVRRVAAWALGRTGDLDVAPALIAALRDADEGVVMSARTGLQVLSRKLDGYGPQSQATAEQKLEAAQKWKAWFEAVRPPDLNAPDDDLVLAPVAPPAAPDGAAGNGNGNGTENGHGSGEKK